MNRYVRVWDTSIWNVYIWQCFTNPWGDSLLFFTKKLQWVHTSHEHNSEKEKIIKRIDIAYRTCEIVWCTSCPEGLEIWLTDGIWTHRPYWQFSNCLNCIFFTISLLTILSQSLHIMRCELTLLRFFQVALSFLSVCWVFYKYISLVVYWQFVFCYTL